MIPYGKQDIDQADIDRVVQVLKSDFITQGPLVPEFEQSICSLVQANFAIAMNSATSALHVACMALGVKQNDLVWTTPISFVASANCALYCGAEIDFVDVDPLTGNITPDALAAKLARSQKKPKLLIAVHLTGRSCEMDLIHSICSEHGIRVIEDASHAIGASFGGEPVGACQFSDIVIFSFHPVKIITTGEGGVAVTNDEALAIRMSELRSHGITKDPTRLTVDSEGPWYYEQQHLGFNYRMTDIHAALGLSQLRKLSSYVERRNDLVLDYQELLSDLPVHLPEIPDNQVSAWHLYVIHIKDAEKDRLQVFNSLREQGIGANVHYIPIYHQPYYQKFQFDPTEFPNAEKYYSRCITLPLFPTMLKSDQLLVSHALRKALA